MTMSFCKDCKHYVEDPHGKPHRSTCDSPQNALNTRDNARYLVTGVEQPSVKAMLGDCMTLRGQKIHPTLGIPFCGPEGIWFEAKES